MSRLLRGRGLFLVLLGLWFHAPVEAQDGPPSSLRAFVSVGGGLGSHGALHASGTLSHSTGDYIVRGALGYDLDIGIFGGGGGWTRVLTEGALLYGRRAETSWGWARGALGVGYVDGEQVTPVSPGEEPSTSAFGVAAQAGVAWTPSPWLGLGLTGLGNLNDFRSFGAVTLSVHLGRTR